MPKIVDHDVVREQIREAAWRVFAEQGVKGVGLERVAAAAGVGRSSLYHYYANKDSLLSDLTVELLRAEERAFAERLADTGSPSERVTVLVDQLLDQFAAWSSIEVVMLDLRGTYSLHFRKFYRTIRRHLSELVQEGQVAEEFDAALDPEQAAACIVGLIDGLLLQFMADRRSFAKMRGWRDTTKLAVARILGQ